MDICSKLLFYISETENKFNYEIYKQEAIHMSKIKYIMLKTLIVITIIMKIILIQSPVYLHAQLIDQSLIIK
jgi:hypothetical protein